MAISNKNILITPNTSGIFGNQPNVVFTGADSSIGDSAAITLTANPQNTGSLNFSASEGQLFSISNNLTDGDIFTVNDVSGIPSLAIDASGIVKIAEYGGRILLGGATDDSTSLLQLNGHLHLTDSSEIRLGNDSDFRIYHDGSQTFIEDKGTGSLIIGGSAVRIGAPTSGGSEFGLRYIQNGAIELYHDNSKKFETTAAGATITGTLTADGMSLGDGEFISIGASTDLRLRSNGTHGYVEHTSGSGSLILKGNNISFRNGADNAQLAKMTNGGSVELYHNDSEKFETTDSGVNVTGNIRINNNPFPASAIATGTIDSARLPAGAFTSGGGTDSAAVIALIDSSYVLSRVTTGSINNIKNDAFTGNASTTAFGLSVTPADSDDVLVFVNGVLQHTNTYSLSGSTITLDSAPDSSSTIDIRTSLIHSTSISLRDFQNYIYTLSSTLDSVSGADSGGNTLTYDADKVDVYVNGARLVNGKDYTAGNGTQIVFDSALHAGNIIEVVSHSKATALEPELTSVDTSLDSAGANQAIYSFSKSAFRTFKFTAQLTHSSSSSFHSEEILLTHNGTTVAMTTYAQVLLDSNLGSFDASISGSNVQLKLSPTKTNVGIKLRGVRTPV